MRQSNFLALGWRDVARTFLVAFVAFLLDFLQKTLIPSLDIPENLKVMVLAGLAYLAKQFFTKPDTIGAKGAEGADLIGGRPNDR